MDLQKFHDRKEQARKMKEKTRELAEANKDTEIGGLLSNTHAIVEVVESAMTIANWMATSFEFIKQAQAKKRAENLKHYAEGDDVK